MTPNFDEYNTGKPSSADSPEGLMLKRDRFELLSAYLDGEVTAAERRQVESWLSSDVAVQQLYARLLKLRQGIRTLPIPTTEQQPVEQAVQQVVARLERRPKRALAWGGLAVAALFVSALAHVLPRNEFSPQMAEAPRVEKTIPSEGLMIALDRPVIEIPKAAVASPKPVLPSSSNVQ